MLLLLIVNQIKAAKNVIFGVCKEYVGNEKVAPPLQGFCVVSSQTLQLMVKFDGRPFWGNDYP